MGIDDELVLVTGASGFIAAHIIKLLQEEGYRVRGTVRSVKDEKKIAHLKKLVKNSKYPLELVEADLNNENSWLGAVKDCTYVLHTASPVPNYVPRDENEVIKPAVNGTLFVLRACVQENTKVKRVVLTSSVSAIAGDECTTGKVYSEKDFASLEKSQAYTKSKILAEKVGMKIKLFKLFFIKQKFFRNLKTLSINLFLS
jgi:nucleoside-diphosphate-sugar epimerase